MEKAQTAVPKKHPHRARPDPYSWVVTGTSTVTPLAMRHGEGRLMGS
jgi:hypothetical protein